MSHKPDFDMVEFKEWLGRKIYLLGRPSKFAPVGILIEEYSKPFGKDMYDKLRSYRNVDSRWYHNCYGFVFTKDKNGHWDMTLNGFVLEFLKSARQTTNH